MDHYEVAVIELLKSKQAGKPLPKATAAKPGNVVNLMDALKRSLEIGGKQPRARAPSIVPTMPKRKKAKAS